MKGYMRVHHACAACKRFTYLAIAAGASVDAYTLQLVLGVLADCAADVAPVPVAGVTILVAAAWRYVVGIECLAPAHIKDGGF